MVARAEDWAWSSLAVWLKPPLLHWLDPGPVPRAQTWLDHVHTPQTEAELERLRQSVNRGMPYGADGWVRSTAARLGLGSTLRPPGRPRTASRGESGDGGLFGADEPGE
jgi:hypothetical protein